MRPDPELGVWVYPPSFALATVATVLYLILVVFHFYLTVIRYRSWCFIWVFVGALLESIGYAARIVSTHNYGSVAAYALQSTFIILAPLFIAAGNYLLISRLIRAVLPEPEQAVFRISPSWLTEIFVICDVVTFIIQASGAAIVASGVKSGSNVRPGNDILIGGLTIQVITFGAFMVLTLKFHSQVVSLRKSSSRTGWVKVLVAIYISSGCILIRTVYRLIEFCLGIDGYPFNHEWIFYTFESLPMLPAITIFCIFHPGKYLPKESHGLVNHVQLESRSINE